MLNNNNNSNCNRHNSDPVHRQANSLDRLSLILTRQTQRSITIKSLYKYKRQRNAQGLFRTNRFDSLKDKLSYEITEEIEEEEYSESEKEEASNLTKKTKKR